MLNNISGYILDMEGTFFKDFSPLPGAKEFIKILEQKGLSYIFLSNLTTKTPDELQSVLLRMGVFTEANSIITPATLTKDYLLKNYPDANVKVFGSNALKSYIYKNYRVGVKDENIDVLVIGMEPNISIADLSSMREIINSGKKVIFTNPDYYAPTRDGFNFECGVMIEIFKPHFKEEPFIIGKPSSYAFNYAIEKLGISKKHIAMVGDTYETDIKGAHNIGIIPIHLQTTQDESYNTVNLDAFEYKDLNDLCEDLKNI